MRLGILAELQAELLSHGPLGTYQGNLWERNCVHHTWASNAIEGNTLARDEVGTVLLKGLSVADRPVRHVMETVQHGAAFMRLLDRVEGPITVATAVELHDAVFRNVLRESGMWRRVELHIRGSGHHPPHAADVDSEMTSWARKYRKRCRAGEPVLALGAWMHHGFEAIHPFDGGNGQVGRLLLDLHMLKHHWPPVAICPGDRDRYFAALEAGHGGDLGELEALLEVVMSRSLLYLLDKLGGEEDSLRPLEELEARGSGFTAYLAHEAELGELPAVRTGDTWRSSQRAVELFGGEGD